MRTQAYRANDMTLPAWVCSTGPAEDVVLSTRARLARNVEGIPFPLRAGDAELKRAAAMVSKAVRESEGRFGRLRVLDPGNMRSLERQSLVDAHVASREQVNGGSHRLVVVNEPGTLSLMVNEEDHLRIQCILPGFQPMTALHMAREFDAFLAGKIRYARADNYGYLTSSVANVGTGLRLSVLLHLAGLGFQGAATDILTAAAKLKTSVRGLFGEGTDAIGHVYQVSNETTIGFSEREIASRVRAAADHLIEREREARRILADAEEFRLAVQEAEDKLLGARTLTGREAILCMSILRLASALGLTTSFRLADFGEMLVSMRLGNLPRHRDTGSINEDIRRAKLIRARLVSNREGAQLMLPVES